MPLLFCGVCAAPLFTTIKKCQPTQRRTCLAAHRATHGGHFLRWPMRLVWAAVAVGLVGASGQQRLRSRGVFLGVDEVNSADPVRCPVGTWRYVICRACAGGKTLARCEPCTAGKYSARSNAPRCDACPTGFYGGGKTKPCRNCPRDSYGVLAGSASRSLACRHCPQGKHGVRSRVSIPGLGRWNSTCAAFHDGGSFQALPVTPKSLAQLDPMPDCRAGRFRYSICRTCVGGRPLMRCQTCAVGKYAPAANASRCSPCPSGFYGGGVACQGCPLGAYGTTVQGSADVGQACAVCPSGKFGHHSRAHAPGIGPWKATCRACPIGKFQSHQHQSSCADCLPGTVSLPNSSACATCPIGQQVNSHRCATCAVGRYSSRRSCYACPVGKFQIKSGQMSCHNCSKGTRGVLRLGNSVECAACSMGSFQHNPGRTACSECPLGKLQVRAGRSSCDLCPVAKYGVSSTSCSDCPTGKSAVPGKVACEACTPRQETETGSCSRFEALVMEDHVQASIDRIKTKLLLGTASSVSDDPIRKLPLDKEIAAIKSMLENRMEEAKSAADVTASVLQPPAPPPAPQVWPHAGPPVASGKLAVV